MLFAVCFGSQYDEEIEDTKEVIIICKLTDRQHPEG